MWAKKNFLEIFYFKILFLNDSLVKSLKLAQNVLWHKNNKFIKKYK